MSSSFLLLLSLPSPPRSAHAGVCCSSFSSLVGLAFVSSSASGSLLIDLVSSFAELLVDISDLLRVSSEPVEASDLLYWVMPVGLSSPSGSYTD